MRESDGQDFIVPEEDEDDPLRWEQYGGTPKHDMFTAVVQRKLKEDAMALWVDPPPMGRSARMSTSVSTEVAHLCADAVQSGVFPWRGQADLLRSAVIWFLLEKVPRSYRQRYEGNYRRMARVQRESALTKANNAVAETVKIVREAVVSFLAIEREGDAVAFLRQALEGLGGTPSENIARDLLEKSMEQEERLHRIWIQATMAPRLVEDDDGD